MKHHISYLNNALLEYYPLHQAEWQTWWHNPRDWVLVSLLAMCLVLWSVIQQRVYVTRVHDIDEMQQRLLHVWRGLEQLLIDDAVDQWQTHLHAYVRASGGHFEHTLWLSICFLCTWWTLCFTPCLMHRVYSECIIKVWNVIFTFSLGNISTLFRWGGNFCHMCIKYFFLLTTVQKLFLKIHQDFPELWSQMYCHLFYGSQCIIRCHLWDRLWGYRIVW